MSFFAELKRRNVLRVGVAYLVLSWLALQVASVLLPTFQAPAWVMRVMVLVLAVGFVATLVASWVYELTPEGLKRESEVDRGESITHRTARKLDIAVIVLLLAVAGVAIVTRGGGHAPVPSPEPAAAQSNKPTTVPAPETATRVDPRPSVAVLPFVNMSAQAENEYFADGLSETLLNMLAQVSGLKVAARTSAFAFKGTKTGIREIARELDVKTVLEGSVQRAGTRVRITAQLIDAADGSHLWSKSYDRTLDDIFAIQDEIATAVAAELTRSLMGAMRAKPPEVVSIETKDTNAYDLYLRGLEQRHLHSYASLPKAERLFKEALALDPKFSDARIALARTYMMMAGTGMIEPGVSAQRGRPVLAPLLERDQAHPVAQAFDAVLHWGAADAATRTAALRRAQETVLRALEQAPNTMELYFLAALVLGGEEGKHSQALEVVERGLEIDPLSNALLHAKGRQLRTMQRYDEALRAHARLREVAPESPNGYNGAAMTYEQRGSYVEAASWYAKAAAIDRDDHEIPAGAAQLLLILGLAAEAGPWVDRAVLLNASGSDTRRVRIQHAEQTGDSAAAMALAREVILERRDNRRSVYGVAVSTYLTLMRETGRLDEALELLGAASPELLGTPGRNPQTDMDLSALWTAMQFTFHDWDADTREARLTRLVAATRAAQAEFDPSSGFDGVLLQAMRGDGARAAELLQALLAQPGRLPWNWRIALRSPALEEVVRNPEVVAAIAKLEADFSQEAKRYRGLVASGEIVVP